MVHIGKDRATGLIVSILGVAIVISSFYFPPTVMEVPNDPGPQIFPMIAAGVLIVCGLILIVQDKSKKDDPKKPFFNKEEWGRFGLLLAAYVGYFLLLWTVGFLLATFIAMFAMCSMFSIGKTVAIWKRLLFSFLVTMSIYAAFYWGLGLRLPLGVLLRLDI
jgi:putative tricarboxylic transport membrane protein